MRLVVGLGNPGRKYEETRHNAGFLVLDYLARKEGLTFSRSKFQVLSARGPVADRDALLVKPLTFMNLSGLAVAGLVRWYRLDPEHDLLVVSDDLDLPLGRLRIRRQGSHGGQRGLHSIIEELGSDKFTRLRIGIGRPKEDMSAKEHVLSTFKPAEEPLVDEVILAAAEAICTWLTFGPVEAMNRFNAFRAGSEASDQ